MNATPARTTRAFGLTLSALVVMVLTSLVATRAEAQNCAAGRYCYYAPPAMPTPTGFTVGWDMVLSTPGPVIHGRYSFDAGATFTSFTLDPAATALTIVTLSTTLGTVSNYSVTETRGIFIDADSADLTFEHRLIVGPWQSSETIKNHTIGLGTRFRAGGYALDASSSANTGHDYVSLYSPYGAIVTVVAPPTFVPTVANPNYWNDGHPGTTVTLTLAAGQTYLLRTLAQDNIALVPEIDGALITSTSPIAVSSGGRGWGGGCGDDGADNLLPIAQLGTQYVVDSVPSGAAYSPVRVVADTDATTVTVNGTLVATLAAGHYYQFVPAVPSTIVTSSAAYVYQNAGLSSCETDIAELPPVAFMGRTTTVTARFNVVGSGRSAMLVETTAAAGTLVDGALATTLGGYSTAAVPGLPTLRMLHFTLGNGTHAVQTNGDFQLGVVTSTPGTGLYAFYNIYRRPGCGDSIIETGEGCDDGNNIDGDGCSSTCLIETTYTGCLGNDALCVPAARCSVNTCTARCAVTADCNDNNTCTTDACNTVSGVCTNTPVAPGTTCVLVPAGAGVCNVAVTPVTCVQCLTGAQCGGTTPACDTGTHTCRACTVATQATDCPASPATACDGSSGACVDPSVTVSAPADGSLSANTTPTISGTATPGQTVTVSVDGVPLGTVVADPASGAWSLPWPGAAAPLLNGAHTASAQVTAGASVATASNLFTVGCVTNTDCTGVTPICDPGAHTCRPCNVATQSMDCDSASVCNAVSGLCEAPLVTLLTPVNGSISPNSTPTLSGTATPGQTVVVTVDGVPVGTAIADATGVWMLPWPAGTPPLGNGPHTAVATVASAASTVSAMSQFTIGCLASTDCTGGTPFCDTGTNVCRACAPPGGPSPDCTASASAPFCSGTGPTAGQCVSAPPVIVAPADGSSTAQGRPTIRGTGPANATVQVVIDGVVVGTAMTDGSGNFTFAPPTALAPGMHTVAAANVTAGVTGPTGAPSHFTVTSCASNTDCAGTTPVCDTGTHTCRACDPAMSTDCVAPTPVCSTTGSSAGMCIATVPTITSPADGSSTASQRPTIQGVATPGTTVAIFVDGVQIGTATVDMNGTFVFTPTADLGLGSHTASAAPFTPAPGDGGADAGGTVGTQGPTVHFTVTSCTTSSECSGGTPICDPTTSMCRACDPAHESTDCTDPMHPACATSGPDQGRCVARAPLVVTPADGSTTMSLRPTITGTGTPGATVVVRVDGVEVGRTTVDASGNWSVTPTGDLAPGMHTVEASNVQTDGSLGTPGNMHSFTVVPTVTDGGMEGGTDAGTDAARDARNDGAATTDGSPDAGVHITGGGACACRTPGGPQRSSRSGLALGLAAAAVLVTSRRRRQR